MTIFERLFLSHPRSVHETYGEHLASAWSFGGRMLVAAAACAVHGIAPFWFERTGSNAVRELHERMVTNRAAHAKISEVRADVRG